MALAYANSTVPTGVFTVCFSAKTSSSSDIDAISIGNEVFTLSTTQIGVNAGNETVSHDFSNWSHVAVVIDTDTKWYINGVHLQTDAVSLNINVLSLGLGLTAGCDIADFRLYNKALSDNAIRFLSNDVSENSGDATMRMF